MAGTHLRVNEMIRVPTIRVVDEKGAQVGIYPTKEALRMAREKNLDLVEVAPYSKPPVCRFLDYGKYRFETEKKGRENRKNQKIMRLKEVRMQPKIDVHDLSFKTRNIKTFLEEGNKVKVTIRFRGRELAHTEMGLKVLERIQELLLTEFKVEKKPTMEGRMMSIILSPQKTKKGTIENAKN